jgi:hypothetical protein
MAQPRAVAGTDKAALDAAKSIILNARRLADALLTSPTPDVPRVEAALALLDSVVAYHKIDASLFAEEILYYRLQIGDLKRDKPEVERRLAELRKAGGKYALYAEKLMYRRASEAWKGSPADTALATAVVRHGLVILGNPSTTPALARSLRASVAEAAAAVWRAEKDAMMRDRAIELDRALIDSGAKSESVLRRYAELVESKGEIKPALEAWRDLLAGLEHPLPEWYEARYNSIRLLWEVDKPGAAEAMRQHKVLFPNPGPEPWGQKLRELDNIIGENFSTSPDSSAGPATPAGKSPGGSP